MHKLLFCTPFVFCYSEYFEVAHQLIQQYSHHLNEIVTPEEHNTTDAKNHFRVMHQLKSKLCVTNCTPQVWPEGFLLHPIIKKYIEWAKEKDQFEEIKCWLKKLISPIDLFILEPKDLEFTCKMQYLYCGYSDTVCSVVIKLEAKHILELFTSIKNFCSMLLENFSQDILDKSTACIKQHIVVYKTCMEKANQKYEKLLLETLLLLLRYDAHLNEFKQIGIKDIQQFNAQTESPIIDYFRIITEQNILNLQTFLFELTTDIGLNSIADDASLITNHISYLVKELSHDLSPLLAAVLNFCSNDCKQIKKYLVVINKGPNWCTELNAMFSNSSIKNVKESSIVNKTNALPQDGSTHSSLQSVLSTLHLTEKYPQQLSIRDALIIKPEISLSDINLSNLPHVVLHKIIACDYRSRSFLLPRKSDSKTNDIEASHSETSDTEASDNDSEKDYDVARGDQGTIHPVDTIVALIHCSDNFLRQILLAKLSVCQMAIPLLLPDNVKGTLTLLLWALRSVKKTWNTLDRNGKVVTRKSSIVDYENPVISFLKCGKLRTSKSELLNNIIGEENIFFHWNLEKYQNYRKVISQGVVELACYYPSIDDSNFNEVITFTNLRGDALKYTKQVTFIESISYISFILISKKSINSGNEDVKVLLQTLAGCPGGLVILLTDARSYKKQKMNDFLQCENFSIICINSKSSAMIQSEIRSYITHKLDNIHSQQFKTISCYADIARTLGITVDEDDDVDCNKGKEKASLLMKHITKSKYDILPLQGKELWGTWALFNKERYRHKLKQPSHDLSVTEYMQSKDEEKTAIRLLQFHCNFSEFTKEFLVSLAQSRNERNYFLHWLKECLNNYSKDILPTLEKEYEQTYMQIKSASDDEVNKRIKNLLNQQNRKLIDASFGLEHCFREVGQLYEAATEIQKDTFASAMLEYIAVLPQIAAEALIDGFELEIMDGEASHIPITWIEAIFNYLEEIFDNKKLFVLSILGVQSSGKSTLLNTMFGLQFNVSAGRCTRGAFVRLLQVDETLKAELNYDIILIVDTEGIRAPELMNEEFEQHDNELATFVIGLADFTIINIYGETPTELSDILQTVLHAFIRMKEVEKNPGCLFVHQNVTEKFANTKLKSSKQVLLNRLDKLTVAVGKEENCQYSKFQEIINFEEDHIVYYFTGLWKGDPPMAPINIGYSQSAQQLKKALLKLIARQQHYCTFKAFKQRIISLWEAILKEGFVFNFKNSIEMSAYGELDIQFNKWSWQLHEALECELIKCDNKIKNSKCDVVNVNNDCIYQSSKELDGKCLTLLEDVDNFFQKHDHASILSKYIFSTKQKLEDLKEECHNKMKHYCSILILQIENNKEKEEMLGQYQEKIREEITELVTNNDSDLSNENLESLFEKSWKQWVENFRDKISFIPFPDDKQICNNIENSLTKTFVNEQGLLITQLNDSSIEERSGLEQNSFEVINVHINPCGNDPAHLQNSANSETSTLIEKASTSIQQKLCNLNVYNYGLIEGELNTLFFSINEFNSASKKFKFTSQYKADIALHICVNAAKQIKTWVKKLSQQSDTMLSLQQQKQKFFKIFENKCLKIAAEKAAAIQLCSSLADQIYVAVNQKMPVKMVSHLKSINENFNSKQGFKLQVLIGLAEAETFDYYRNYVVDSTTSFKNWAKFYCEKHFQPEGNVCNESIIIVLANEEVQEIISKVQNAISEAGSYKWLEHFCTILSGIIKVNKREWKNDLEDIVKSPESMKSFKMHLNEELNVLQNSGKIEHRIYFNILELTESAGNKLFNSIMGASCKARCPFCKEECDNPVSDHLNHSVKLHRPQCIGRTTWLTDKKLVIDVCNTLVASDNDIVITENDLIQRIAFKDYKKKYPRWDISGESIVHPPTYWMWVIAHFYKDILSWTNGNATDIPDVWKRITKEKAIQSLFQPNTSLISTYSM